MKFRVTFKTPDALTEPVEEATKVRFEEIRKLIPHREEDVDELMAEVKQHILDDLKKWVLWGELVVIEFDTSVGTATVTPVTK